MYLFLTSSIICLMFNEAFLVDNNKWVEEGAPQIFTSHLKINAAEQGLSSITVQKIARLRAAMVRFNEIDEAILEVYITAITVYRKKLCFQYIYPEPVDYRFEPIRPEFLVYLPVSFVIIR